MPRPLQYTPEVGKQICDALCEGVSLRSWCAEDGHPCYSTVFKWLTEVEPFAEAYAQARTVQAHNDADRINACVEAAELGKLPSDVMRAVVDALKWTASRRLPKVYGDKVALETGDNAPIVVMWSDGTKV